jgi:hypothetical protein
LVDGSDGSKEDHFTDYYNNDMAAMGGQKRSMDKLKVLQRSN